MGADGGRGGTQLPLRLSLTLQSPDQVFSRRGELGNQSSERQFHGGGVWPKTAAIPHRLGPIANDGQSSPLSTEELLNFKPIVV